MLGGKIDPLDALVLSLDSRDDADEQDLKDKIHGRLMARSSAEEDCLVWYGAWNKHDQGVIRIGATVHTVSRAAAWCHIAGFQLWGDNVAVRTCRRPGCCNSDHLLVYANWRAAWMAMIEMKKVGWIAASPKKRKSRPSLV